MQDYVSLRAASRALKLSPKSVERLIMSGCLSAVRLDGQSHPFKVDIRALLRAETSAMSELKAKDIAERKRAERAKARRDQMSLDLFLEENL